MANLNDLNARVRQVQVDIDNLINNSVVNLVIAILRDLLNNTPVDTGKAISNWQVSLTGPIRNEIESYSVGTAGSTKNVVIANAIGQAVGILAARRPHQPIYLGNAVPYIVRLNQGSSRQAPAGFIDSAFLRARLTQGAIRLNYG